jgi:hypothetical protein
LAIFVMAASFAASVMGQAVTGSRGNIYGHVVDETGGAIPGASVTLSGVGAPHTTTTGGQGEFRFLSLAAGSYTLKSELSGFATVTQYPIYVAIGTNTEISIPMKISAVATSITITSESPLLDTRKTRTGTNFSQEELKSIPSSRDPWGVLQQTAGVLLDKVQTGSQESGQQSVFVGKGTNFNNNAWNVDGVSFTDLAATGASPTYWDFDSFQEMQMTTGGADPSIGTPGVTLNLVTKRGTNDAHGSARVFLTPKETEAYNTPQEAKDQGILTNRVDSVRDFGAEVGGPVVADKAWLWGSFGHSDINTIVAGGRFDRTQLENYAAKANVQPVESNSLSGFYFRGNKTKQGRSAGTTRPQETSWDQSGPSHIWKVDDSQVFGPNLVASLVWSYGNTPFSLTPEATLNGSNADPYIDAAAVWHRNYQFSGNYRPQHQVQATASYFFNTGAMSHEIKAGFAYINFQSKTTTFWEGTGNYGDEKIRYPTDPGGFTKRANITRGSLSAQQLHGYGGFIGDTITMSNLTLNLGVRYDQGKSKNLPSNVSANPIFPEILGDEVYPGGDYNVNVKSWEPRFGITYALGADKKTLLRASYARFADQGGVTATAFDNPNGGIYRARYRWNDLNGNHTVDRGELGANVDYNYDPASPNAPTTSSVVDPHLKAPKTDEFIVGFDHEIMPNLVAGASYTYRERKNFTWTPYTQLTRMDYHLCDPSACADPQILSDGTANAYDQNGNLIGHTGPIYYASLPDNFDYGQTYTNRPDYKTTYSGIELQVTKRLSGNWMMHGSFAYQNWKQKVGNVATGCIDPTNQVDLVTVRGNTCANNDIAYDYSGTSWINSKWQFNIAGLYQLPLNFNVSAQLFGRQGYPVPFYTTVDPGDGLGSRVVAVGKADKFRLKNLYELDLRIEKVIPLFQKADVTLSIDMFNAFNSNTVLLRDSDGTPADIEGGDTTATAKTLRTVQVPRTLRFGARVSF